MSDLRQRQVPSSHAFNKQRSAIDSQDKKQKKRGNAGISLLDILRVLVTLVLVSCGLSYYMTSSESLLWGYRPWFTRWPLVVQYIVNPPPSLYPLESLRGTESAHRSLEKQKGPIHLTPTELSLYNGTDPSLPIYLAVNGTIFDVSANRMMYGPGGHYNFFTGRDASRAFVTGCFQEDLTHDLRGVEEMFIPIDDDEEAERVKGMSSGERKIRREQDVRVARGMVRRTVQHWEGFFRGHKRYFEVGRVVGLVVPGEKRELCQTAVQQRPERSTRGGH